MVKFFACYNETETDVSCMTVCEGRDLCGAKRCTGKGQICVVKNHNQAVCQCRESCPRPGHKERVCGSDGIPYPSRCILDMTSCKLGTDITVDSNRCKGTMTVCVYKCVCVNIIPM